MAKKKSSPRPAPRRPRSPRTAEAQSRTSRDPSILPTAALVWLGIAVAMIVNGAMRELLFRPVMGYRGGFLLFNLVGIGIVLAVSHLFVRLRPDLPHRRWMHVGFLWLALTITFEFLFGYFVLGRPWDDLLAAHNILRGEFWPLLLVTTLIAPTLWSRVLHRRSSANLWFRP